MLSNSTWIPAVSSTWAVHCKEHLNPGTCKQQSHLGTRCDDIAGMGLSNVSVYLILSLVEPLDVAPKHSAELHLEPA